MTVEEYDSLPSRTDPEKLQKLCEFLNESGSASIEKIENEVDISERDLRATITYAENLSFIQQNDGEYTATGAGFDLALADRDSPDTAELFRSSIAEYPLYSDLITNTWKDHAETIRDEMQVTEEQFIRVLRTTLGFTEYAQDTLGSGVRTLFKTLERAGCGEYKQAYRGNPNRVELSESGFEFIQSLNQDSAPEDEKSASSTPTDNDINQESSTEPTTTNGTSDRKSQTEKRTTEDSEKDRNTRVVAPEPDSENILLQFNIDISNNTEPEKIQETILAVRQGLAVDLHQESNQSDSEEG